MGNEGGNVRLGIMTKDDEINVLVAEIKKRRNGCPILLSVQVLSAVVATNMTQDDIDEAFRRAEAET